MSKYLFTSESVSAGHPDKVADQISDAILDELLAQRPDARGAIEVLITEKLITIAGEKSADVRVDAPAIARQVLQEIGYDPTEWDSIVVRLQNQSVEIAEGVDKGGAGDQGLMFGFACNESEIQEPVGAYMPAAIYYAHRILQEFDVFRRANPGTLNPDAKSQVTLEYVDGKPTRVDTVVVSHQQTETFTNGDLEAQARKIFARVFPAGWFDADTVVHINPAGSFIKGGPAADTGLTGRKIIVDTYGGAAPHGGGAFSGKDPTKVDRSAAYAARWVAKNVVAAGLADRCLIQLAYAIGVAEPVSLYVNTFGTGTKISDEQLARILRETVSLTPNAIRERLRLDAPIYRPTASYGHFGRKAEGNFFTWEGLDLVEKLRAAV